MPGAIADTPPICATTIICGRARRVAAGLYLDEKIKDYIVELVYATREPEKHKLGSHKNLIAYGASPRATIALDLCARAYAWLQGRDYVSPEDVQAVAYDVLRHRILVSFEAEAEGVTSDAVIGELLRLVPAA